MNTPLHDIQIKSEILEHGEKYPNISCEELDRQRAEWKELALNSMDYDYFLAQCDRIENAYAQ